MCSLHKIMGYITFKSAELVELLCYDMIVKFVSDSINNCLIINKTSNMI